MNVLNRTRPVEPRGLYFVRIWTKGHTILMTTPDFDTLEGAQRMMSILWSSWVNDNLRAWSVGVHRVSDGVCVKNVLLERKMVEPRRGSWA
jgi:hypothetical protein